MAKEGRDEKGKFAAGNLFRMGMEGFGGRPPEYEEPEEMMKKIAEYLDWEDKQKRPDSYSKMGKGIYTLSGCALFLGFASLQSLYDYEKRSPKFSYIINRFRLFMTHWNEQKLYWGGTFQGSNFWLKNFGGYSDESTVNQNTTITELKVEVNNDSPDLEDKE
jgi:hypothetical protein